MKRASWTPAMEAKLIRMYPTNSAKECAAAIGVGVSSVHSRVSNLGLSKSAEWIAERTRQRWVEGRHENSRRATFRPGQVPHNKGRPMAEWNGNAAACRETQFKRGRPAHEARNYQPIGTERVNRDGQVIRKVTDDPSVYPAKRWVAVHRLVWEAARGPIPAAHIVVFKAGQATTDSALITVDRLECITRVENMRRNSYHNNYPKEVAQLIQLRGALNRKIGNRINRTETEQNG